MITSKQILANILRKADTMTDIIGGEGASAVPGPEQPKVPVPAPIAPPAAQMPAPPTQPAPIGADSSVGLSGDSAMPDPKIENLRQILLELVGEEGGAPSKSQPIPMSLSPK